ncbi:hypothetical protein V5E97_35740 [Singulisphaera sp. Ch08]|uniref:Uncharacterized protein n=1 Tax=Singulisphaera sp. Ch08 TaxID=3120278 RepID=A0AAU7CEW5_9BACT
MTELDWFTCADPQALVAFLEGRVDARKLRLFAAACCGRIQDLFDGDRDRDALVVIEGYADGRADQTELGAVPDWTTNPALAQAATTRAVDAAAYAAAACSTLRAAAYGDLTHPVGQGDYDSAEAGEKTVQCRLLRDLCGNPFRAVTADPGWRTPTVLALARAIYAERAFDRMPGLVEALEEAGCADDAVLAHCLRWLGPHSRGCWVIDLILKQPKDTPVLASPE